MTTAQEAPNHGRVWLANLVFLALCGGVAALIYASLWERDGIRGRLASSSSFDPPPGFLSTVEKMDQTLQAEWAEAALTPAPRASDLAIARRLSLALTGTIPSVEEIRALESQAAEGRLQWWLSYLFEDQRTSQYLAERFARVYVGTEGGPFILYRRGRFLSWLSGELKANRPYDELVRDLLTARGISTTQPEANFITFTLEKEEKEKMGRKQERQVANPVKLAARTTRAFLGVRIDCMECHDDKFSDRWNQEDFHQLAAFFATTESSLTGIRDDPNRIYEYRYLGEREATNVSAVVPFAAELLPQNGSLRSRLAQWVTHPDNRPFARTTVNRVWALLFGRPLVEPIDDIPLEGPWPATMELLADDFVEHGFDLRRLIRVIAASQPYQLDSRSNDADSPVTPEHEIHWASFPLTRLRPEQVAQSVIQASSLRTIDARAHILQKLGRFGQTNDFVKRFGDLGEEEFADSGGTIPQRLLLMNGELVEKRTEGNLLMNAAPRIAAVSPSDTVAVETAYLAVLSRRPTNEESTHFQSRLHQKKGPERTREMQDLYWTLMNSTEFSWNH